MRGKTIFRPDFICDFRPQSLPSWHLHALLPPPLCPQLLSGVPQLTQPSGHVPLECSIDISRPNLNSSFPGNHFFRLSRVKKVLLFPSLGFRNQELNVSPSQDAYSTVVTRLVSMGLKKCALLPPEENDRTTGQTLKSVFRGLRPYRDRHHRTH